MSQVKNTRYVGQTGVTQDCVDAVMRIIQSDEDVRDVTILTRDNRHGLQIRLAEGDRVLVQEGFGSGYNGEGARGLSEALTLLGEIDVPITEVGVNESFFARMAASALTAKDFAKLDCVDQDAGFHRPKYVWSEHYSSAFRAQLWKRVPPVIPLSIIDDRILSRALDFWRDPDAAILSAFRIVEQAVKDRVGLDLSGQKLFGEAFNRKNQEARIYWQGISDSQQDGLAKMFMGAYATFRNPRAHQKIKASSQELLAEFLSVNQLLRLEATAVTRDLEALPTPTGT